MAAITNLNGLNPTHKVAFKLPQIQPLPVMNPKVNTGKVGLMPSSLKVKPVLPQPDLTQTSPIDGAPKVKQKVDGQSIADTVTMGAKVIGDIATAAIGSKAIKTPKATPIKQQVVDAPNQGDIQPYVNQINHQLKQQFADIDGNIANPLLAQALKAARSVSADNAVKEMVRSRNEQYAQGVIQANNTNAQIGMQTQQVNSQISMQNQQAQYMEKVRQMQATTDGIQQLGVDVQEWSKLRQYNSAKDTQDKYLDMQEKIAVAQLQGKDVANAMPTYKKPYRVGDLFFGLRK